MVDTFADTTNFNPSNLIWLARIDMMESLRCNLFQNKVEELRCLIRDFLSTFFDFLSIEHFCHAIYLVDNYLAVDIFLISRLNYRKRGKLRE